MKQAQGYGNPINPRLTVLSTNYLLTLVQSLGRKWEINRLYVAELLDFQFKAITQEIRRGVKIEP